MNVRDIQLVSWQTVIRDSVVGIAQGRICIPRSANKHQQEIFKKILYLKESILHLRHLHF